MKNPADERAVRSRRRILDATQAIMIERGVEAATIRAVAERAHVQRSTVYNHWPDRVSLVVAALEDFATGAAGQVSDDHDPDHHDVDEVTPIDRVRAVVLGLATNLRGDWGTIAASLAAAAEHDHALAAAHQVFVQTRRREVAALITAALDAGELAPGVDPDWATALLVGPLYYERLVVHRPMTGDAATDHIDRVLALLRRTP